MGKRNGEQMMRLMVFLLVIMVGFIAFSRDNGDHAVKMAEVAYQAERIKEQDEILISLQSIGDPAVSRFVEDWRDYAPKPSIEQLSELRQINANIRKDKATATQYTLSWHQESGLCSKISSPFGDSGCAPGL